MTMVRYVNFRHFAARYGDEMHAIFARVLDSGRYIGGNELVEFERKFASFCETAHAIGVANGQDALELTLRAWNVGPGDEVIVPANTFVATALAVSHTGARLVLCDAEPDSGSINVAAVASAITPATRVIIPVHLFGHPADIDALVEIARDRGIRILEDAAHAHGATYKGRRCGGLADAAAFSFYPTKNLGALGDAGCVTTDDAELAGRLRSLRDRGAASRDLYLELGYNSRLDAVQAAILRWKLERVDEWNRRRNDLARFYLFELSGVHGVVLPAIRSWAKPVWHAFAILVPGSIRDEVQQALLEDGIETNVHYRLPIHLQPCYSDRGWQRGDYPVSERRADESLSLPLDPFHTENEVARVVASLRNALNRLRVAG